MGQTCSNLDANNYLYCLPKTCDSFHNNIPMLKRADPNELDMATIHRPTFSAWLEDKIQEVIAEKC